MKEAQRLHAYNNPEPDDGVHPAISYTMPSDWNAKHPLAQATGDPVPGDGTLLTWHAGAATREVFRTLLGTANQITVAIADESITLTLPQNIHAAATPVFASLGLNTAAGAVGTLTMTGSLNSTSAGPHAFGGSVNTGVAFYLRGTFVSTAAFSRALQIDQTLTAASDGGNLVGIYLNPTFTERAAGTHSIIASIYIEPIITNAGALVTDATGIYIATFAAGAGTTSASAIKINAAPTGATTNYALWVAAGRSQFQGNVGVSSANEDLAAFQVGSTADTTGKRIGVTSDSVTANTMFLYVQGSAEGGTHAGIGRAGKWIAPGGLGFPLVISHSAAQPIVFGTNDTERMRIDFAGNVGIGGIPGGTRRLEILGTFTSTNPEAFRILATLVPSGDANSVFGVVITPTLTRPPSGAGVLATALYVDGGALAAAGGSITSAASLYIAGAMSGATNNYALFVDAGVTRIDGGILFAAVANPGTATPAIFSNTGPTLTFRGGSSGYQWLKNDDSSFLMLLSDAGKVVIGNATIAGAGFNLEVVNSQVMNARNDGSAPGFVSQVATAWTVPRVIINNAYDAFDSTSVLRNIAQLFITQDASVSGYFSFSTNAGGGMTEKWRIAASGNLMGFNGGVISRGTTNGTDNAVLQIGGGGDVGTDRGAYINLHGNEHGSTGKMQLFAGDVTGGDLEFYTAASVLRMVVGRAGSVSVGGFSPTTYTSTYTAQVQIGTQATGIGSIHVIGDQTVNGAVAAIEFINDAVGLLAEPRLALIQAERAGANNTGMLALYVINAGSAVERMRWTADGNVKLAGSAVRGTTEGTNHLDIFDGTAPVGTLTNGISLYSTAGELRVMDASGNATLLSPHDRGGYWIYDSKNTVTGKVLRIDMERMMKAINERFGWDFVKEFIEP